MLRTLLFLRRHAAAVLALAMVMGGSGVAYGVADHSTTAASRATRVYACVAPHTHIMRRISPTKSCRRASTKISWSIAGPAGPQGRTGARGAPGQDGVDGTSGGAGASEFAEFFALAPPDNAATVAPGTDVTFPQDGPSLGTIQRTDSSSFNLADVGTYEVSFSVPVDEAGQLELTLNGADLAYTVVGRATGTSPISGTSYVETTTVDSLLTVRNPAGNSTALTVTPLAGGTRPVASTLTIKRLH